jgi:hypothetical protein
MVPAGLLLNSRSLLFAPCSRFAARSPLPAFCSLPSVLCCILRVALSSLYPRFDCLSRLTSALYSPPLARCPPLSAVLCFLLSALLPEFSLCSLLFALWYPLYVKLLQLHRVTEFVTHLHSLVIPPLTHTCFDLQQEYSPLPSLPLPLNFCGLLSTVCCMYLLSTVSCFCLCVTRYSGTGLLITFRFAIKVLPPPPPSQLPAICVKAIS